MHLYAGIHQLLYQNTIRNSIKALKIIAQKKHHPGRIYRTRNAANAFTLNENTMIYVARQVSGVKY